jgi:hypothetical protein
MSWARGAQVADARLTVFGHVEQDFGGVAPESVAAVDERSGPGPLVALVLVPAIWIVQIGQRHGEHPVCFCGIDWIDGAGLTPVGDDRGDVEVRDADMKARKRDQWVDADGVEANFFGCFPQGSGRRAAISRLSGAAREGDLTWMVSKGRAALQQNHFGTVAGVFEKYEDGRLPISDTCCNGIVGVELARCGGAQRGNEPNKSAGNGDGVILWSGFGQPVVHRVSRLRARIGIWHRSVHHADDRRCGQSVRTESLLHGAYQLPNVSVAPQCNDVDRSIHLMGSAT